MPGSKGEKPAIKQNDLIVWTRDLPEHGLKRGDMGTVAHIHRDTDACGIEFMTLDGEPIILVSLAKDRVRSVGPGEILHARSVETRA